MKFVFTIALMLSVGDAVAMQNVHVAAQDVRTRHMERLARIKRQYELLRLTLTQYRGMLERNPSADKRPFLRSFDRSFHVIREEEQALLVSNNNAREHSLQVLRTGLEGGLVDIGAFDNIMAVSISAPVTIVSSEAERKRADDVRRQDAAAQPQTTSVAQRPAAGQAAMPAGADAKTAAADEEEARTNPLKGQGEEDDSDVLNFLLEAGSTSLAAKTILLFKASNPYLAAGVGAMQIYRWYKYMNRDN